VEKGQQDDITKALKGSKKKRLKEESARGGEGQGKDADGHQSKDGS